MPATLLPLILTLFWAERKAKRLGIVDEVLAAEGVSREAFDSGTRSICLEFKPILTSFQDRKVALWIARAIMQSSLTLSDWSFSEVP